jgi:hypothetical protein
LRRAPSRKPISGTDFYVFRKILKSALLMALPGVSWKGEESEETEEAELTEP